MAYVALKPCAFAGNPFRIGEEIPEDVVLPGAVNNLVSMGVIAKKPETATADAFCVYAHASDGDIPLNITPADAVQIFDILQSTATDAADQVSVMENGDALILLDVIDSRKAVKAAVRARADELDAEDNADVPGEEKNAQEAAQEAGEA